MSSCDLDGGGRHIRSDADGDDGLGFYQMPNSNIAYAVDVCSVELGGLPRDLVDDAFPELSSGLFSGAPQDGVIHWDWALQG